MPRLRFKLNWSLALLALPLAAQTDRHNEASLTATLWSTTPVMVDHAPATHNAPSGTVSAELLRYPLSAKALIMLRKALQMSDKGDHPRAIQQLQETLTKCRGTEPYVYSLIGVEYLRTEQIPQALEALQQSVKLVPHDASNHANLGLALLSEAQYDRAETELKRALDLDPHYKMATQLLAVLATARDAQNSLLRVSGDSR